MIMPNSGGILSDSDHVVAPVGQKAHAVIRPELTQSSPQKEVSLCPSAHNAVSPLSPDRARLQRIRVVAGPALGPNKTETLHRT